MIKLNGEYYSIKDIEYIGDIYEFYKSFAFVIRYKNENKYIIHCKLESDVIKERTKLIDFLKQIHIMYD